MYIISSGMLLEETTQPVILFREEGEIVYVINIPQEVFTPDELMVRFREVCNYDNNYHIFLTLNSLRESCRGHETVVLKVGGQVKTVSINELLGRE